MDQDRALNEFIEKHGQPVYRSSWCFFADGTEGEHTVLGFRGIPGRDPERQQQVRQLFWKYRLEDLQTHFRQVKQHCESLADMGRLTDDDIEDLERLQEQVQHAAAELDALQNPPGPDPVEVRRAIKAYRTLRQLAWDCGEAEQAYHEAEEDRRPCKKLGLAWQQKWDLWDQANQKFQKIDESVRRAAEGAVADEDHRNKINTQRTLVQAIEV